jgi:hypothetical protein
MLVYFRSSSFRSYIYSIDIRYLTIFHVWRIPAALGFFWYGAQGLLPEQFVFNAAWGDFIAGILAIIITFWVAKSQRRKLQGYIAFNLFSITDFIIAVGTGLTFTLLQHPLMDNLKLFPMALIPLFGVPVTGALSLMAIHRLLTHKA